MSFRSFFSSTVTRALTSVAEVATTVTSAGSLNEHHDASVNNEAQAINAARTAAYSAEHRSYTLIPGRPVKKIKFLVFGCQGNAAKEQHDVAKLMGQLVTESRTSVNSAAQAAEHAPLMAASEAAKSPATPQSIEVIPACCDQNNNDTDNEYTPFDPYAGVQKESSHTPLLSSTPMRPLALAQDASQLSSSPTRSIGLFQEDRDIPRSQAASLTPTPAPVIETQDEIIFYIVLGDNFYDDGVGKPNDDVFRTHFYNIYGEHLKNLPAFVILGNHDEGRYTVGQYKKKAGLGSTDGIDLGMNQVAHTYLGNTNEKIKIYNSDTLKLDELQQWNMPSRYYSLIIDDLEIFMLDSNTYVSEFLALKKSQTADSNNQAYWLQERYTKAKKAGRTVMLAQHHPLFTPGKRAYNSDKSLYLNDDEIMSAKSTLQSAFNNNENPSYNTLLWETFKMQQLVFDTVFAAHDHSLSYFNNKADAAPSDQLCQIISAGAGGSLQQRRSFKEQNHVGTFMKKHGVVSIEYNPLARHDIRYTFLTRDHRLLFSSMNTSPVLTDSPDALPEEQQAIRQFLITVKQAIDLYFSFWNNRQDQHHGRFQWGNITHGDDGLDRAHELWAYINDISTPNKSLSDIVAHVAQLFNRSSTAAAHSLITELNKKMNEHYNMNLHEYQEQLSAISRYDVPVRNIASP